MKTKKGHLAIVSLWHFLPAQKLEKLKMEPHSSNKKAFVAMKKRLRLPKSQNNLMA